MNIDEINIIYKVKGNEVKLFNKYFVDNNKINCKLIINGKEQELIEKYSFGIFSTKKDILEIKLKGITNITNMGYMFSDCSSLLSLPDISKWNTSNVTNMCCMFYNCSSLLSLPDISNWNTSNVKDMKNMFFNCSSSLSFPGVSALGAFVVGGGVVLDNYLPLLSLPGVSKWNVVGAGCIPGVLYGCKDSLNNTK